MSNLINRISNNVILFVTLILLTNLNLSAQYKLELEWIKNFDGMGVDIFSIFKSANDSIFYFSSWNQIYTMKSPVGSIVKIDTMDYVYSRIILSSDDKTLVAITSNGGENGIGLLEPFTFKRKYWIKDPSCRSISYSEKQNKFVANYSPDIRVYDVVTQKLDKEYKTGLSIYQANLTDDGEHLIYTYSTTVESPKGVFKTRYYLRIVDLKGNILKEIKEIGSGKFSFTNDGKELIYFNSATTNFLDLETFQDKIKFQIGGDVENLEISSDGKFMLIGKRLELHYLEFDSKRSFLLNDNSSWWKSFKLNSTNTELFFGVAYSLVKFKIIPTTSITQEQNKLELTINLIGNNLILTNPQNHQINNLIAYDILGRTYSLSANGNEVDVSILSAGKYFLKVGLADGSFLDFSFVKE